MLTLAIDTAANFCSACVFDDAAQAELAAEERDIGRGHAEELTGVIEPVMRSAGVGFGDIGRIGVTVGPGSFTGIRVGVAAARGFGVALSVPVAGVTTLAALAADAAGEAGERPLTVAIRGGRGQVFLQSFGSDGHPTGEPLAIAEEDAAGAVPGESAFLAGNAAAEIGAALGRDVPCGLDRATGSIVTVARLSVSSTLAPSPLYLRGADAKPQSGFALPRRDGGAAA